MTYYMITVCSLVINSPKVNISLFYSKEGGLFQEWENLQNQAIDCRIKVTLECQNHHRF